MGNTVIGMQPKLSNVCKIKLEMVERGGYTLQTDLKVCDCVLYGVETLMSAVILLASLTWTACKTMYNVGFYHEVPRIPGA